MNDIKVDEHSIYNHRFRVRLECIVGFFCSKVQGFHYTNKVWNVTICLGSGHSIHQHMTTEEKDMVSRVIGGGKAPANTLEEDFGCYLDGDGL